MFTIRLRNKQSCFFKIITIIIISIIIIIEIISNQKLIIKLVFIIYQYCSSYQINTIIAVNCQHTFQYRHIIPQIWPINWKPMPFKSDHVIKNCETNSALTRTSTVLSGIYSEKANKISHSVIFSQQERFISIYLSWLIQSWTSIIWPKPIQKESI